MRKHIVASLLLISLSLYSATVGYLLGHGDGYVIGHKIGKLDERFKFRHNGILEVDPE